MRAATKLKPQELSNAAWAFATLRVPDGEVLLAVSGAARAKLPQLADVDLANVAWSFVTVTFEEDPIVAAIGQVSKERLQDGCIESESGVVNCLALVEAFQLAGKLEDSYLESALKSLLHHGHSMDGSEHLMPPPAELSISVARLETDVISEPLILSEASQPELYALWKPPNCSAASEEIRNPAARSEEPLALRNWLQEHFGHRAIVHDESVTYGMVHRLDRFTSGVLLWAPCYQGLYEARLQFAARRVRKEYLCLAQGVVKDVPLLIKAPIAEGSSELGATRSYISPIGRHAFTEVVDSATLADPDGQLFSLMQVRLHTGRTHQIRCHLAHEGHPLVGDPVYGGITPSWCQRHWLHAWKLSLQMTRGPVAVQVPVPHDLRRAVQRLRPAEVADAFRLRQWLG